MATEYISREAAIEIICDPCAFKAACNAGVEPRCKYYIRMAELPAADVRPVVKAVWVPVSERWHEYPFYKCSSCGAKSGFSSRFCPNCGAHMREELKECRTE